MLNANNRNYLDNESKLLIARQLADSMLYLHNHKFLHGFLNPYNVIVNLDELRSYVTDYGLLQLKDDIPVESLRSAYIGPEFYTKDYSYKLDIFSFGMVLYELFTGITPYEGIQSRKQIQYIIANVRPEIPITFPPILAKLITACWNSDEDARPHFSKIKQILSYDTKSLLSDGSSLNARKCIEVEKPARLGKILSADVETKTRVMVDVIKDKLATRVDILYIFNT